MNKIIFVAFLVANFSFSQSNGTTEQTSSKIKVYSPSSDYKANTEMYRWALKTDIFKFVAGEFPIIGEYRITEKLSLEGSAGVTHSFWGNGSLFSEDEDSYFETKAAFGTAFRGGIKYYPSSSDKAIEGWAFGVQLFTKTNNRDYIDNGYSSSFTDHLTGNKDVRTTTGLNLTISSQVEWESNIFIEWTLGFGFSNVTRDYFTRDFVNISGNSQEVLKPISKDEVVPNVQLGCRLGFGN